MTSLTNAAKKWSVTPLKFSRGTDLTGSPNTSTSAHGIYYALIPAGHEPCTTRSVACTLIYPPNKNHMTDADTILNQYFRDNAPGFTTTCDPNDFAGLLGYNVETIMLHEFGHWGHIPHAFGAPGSVMQEEYTGCKTTLKDTDKDSMTELYQGSHGELQ